MSTDRWSPGSAPPRTPGARRRPTRRLLRSSGLLASLLALTLASGQEADRTSATLPESAAVLGADLLAASYATSEAQAVRAMQVAAAKDALAEAYWGLEASLDASPSLAYRWDLGRETTTFAPRLDVDLELGARLDRDAVLRAEGSLSTAEARWRAQVRADQRAAALALSTARLTSRRLADMRASVAEAERSLASAVAAGSPRTEVERLNAVLRLAMIELEREESAAAEGAASLAELGVEPSIPPFAPQSAAALTGPVPAGTLAASVHGDLAEATIAARRARLAVDRSAFEVLPEVELTAGYRSAGLLFGAEIGLRRGVPTADARLGWRSGDVAHRLDVGLSATLLLSDASWRRSNLAPAELAAADRSLAQVASDLAAAEARALRSLELAYEELRLHVVLRDLAAGAAAGPEENVTPRALADARRAEDAAERAWQRYVRALFEYLETIDAVLEAPADGR